MSTKKRGALITIEGIDKSGKTPLSRRLLKTLKEKGQKVEKVKFPARETQIGGIINNYLKEKLEIDDRAIHLLFSANRWEKQSEMIQKLNNGTTLILDRYAYSGVAYSAAKGLDWDWCKLTDQGLPQPDLVLFLKLKPDIAATKENYGQERYENIDIQEKAALNFENLKTETWKEIDVENGIVYEEILPMVENIMEEVKDKPIGKLWA